MHHISRLPSCNWDEDIEKEIEQENKWINNRVYYDFVNIDENNAVGYGRDGFCYDADVDVEEECDEFVEPIAATVSNYIQPAVSNYIQPTVINYIQPAVINYIQPAVSNYIQPILTDVVKKYAMPIITTYALRV